MVVLCSVYLYTNTYTKKEMRPIGSVTVDIAMKFPIADSFAVESRPELEPSCSLKFFQSLASFLEDKAFMSTV